MSILEWATIICIFVALAAAVYGLINHFRFENREYRKIMKWLKGT